MAEDIVACSGCGKKFRIPDGSPPSGKFACTACGADVAWGGTAAAAVGGCTKVTGKARPRRHSGKGVARGDATSRGARRARGRRGRDADAGDEGGGGRRGHLPKEKENKTLPLVVALMGIVLLIGGLIIALTGKAPDYEKQAAEAGGRRPAQNGSGSGGISSGDTAMTGTTPDQPSGSTEPETPAQPLVPVPPDEDGADEEPSGIGGTQTAEQRTKDYRYWFLRDESELFTEIEPVDGTTPEEAAKLRELAALATDFDAGARGMRAEGELADIGRKAIPFLLSQFQKAWNGSKWAETNEQFACSKIQQLAREITKADGPPSDLFVRFPPGPGVEPSHYQRAAKMWTAWWRGEGRYIEKFKSYEDEE